MPQHLIFCFLFLSLSCLAENIDFEKIKEANKPLATGCFDLTTMDKVQASQAIKLFNSFKRYVKVNPPSDLQRKKGIDFDLKAVGVNKDGTLFIFRKKPALATEPGDILRSENREILRNTVKAWHLKSQDKTQFEPTVRFDDECRIPDRCNDYHFDPTFIGKFKRFGCK